LHSNISSLLIVNLGLLIFFLLLLGHYLWKANSPKEEAHEQGNQDLIHGLFR